MWLYGGRTPRFPVPAWVCSDCYLQCGCPCPRGVRRDTGVHFPEEQPYNTETRGLDMQCRLL